MSKVRVYPSKSANECVDSFLLDRAGEAVDLIRRRAFALFEARGSAPGSDLDDWLQAEKEQLSLHHAEVNESQRSFRMMISAPGFEAGDIAVIAKPDEVQVEAWTEVRMEPRRDNMRAGALESRVIHRRFPLPVPIETDQVTARIDEGCLTIEAPKKIIQQLRDQAAAA